MKLLFGLITAGLPLLIVEYISRRFRLPAELSRKLVHIFSCLVVILLPLWLTLRQITCIAALFCVILAISHGFRVWHSLYGIRRQSWGEVAFAASVLLVSLFAHSESIFIAAIAVMGLADPAASFVGQQYGKHRIAKTHKSIEGSGSFLIVSIIILLLAVKPSLVVLGTALAATISEAVSSYGFDNFTVPIVVMILLNTT